jgi:hypothetical protein
MIFLGAARNTIWGFIWCIRQGRFVKLGNDA